MNKNAQKFVFGRAGSNRVHIVKPLFSLGSRKQDHRKASTPKNQRQKQNTDLKIDIKHTKKVVEVLMSVKLGYY